MTRLLALALVVALAGCIDKPGLPSDRADGAPGDGDGGAIDGDAGPCGQALDSPTAWAADDQIRFDRDQGKINADCLEDLVIPGVRGPANGVFVVLGRSQEMLVGGYDGFVDTSERVPVDVKLTDLVGDESLDLLVLSTGEDELGDPATAVRVYEGKGDGEFQATFVENQVEGLELVIGDFDSPEPLYIDTFQMDASEPPSIIFGDAAITRTLSPSTWEDSDTVANVEEQPLVSDGETTTDLWPVGSARADVDDLVRLTQGQMSWYANEGPAAYSGANVIENPLPGVGRATRANVDDDGYGDIGYSRNDQVWITLLEPGAVPSDPGTSEQLEVDPSPDFGDKLDFAFEDIHLAQLDGDDTAGDLVLVSGAPNGGSFLWVYPNLEKSGTFIVNASDGLAAIDVFGETPEAAPNRAFVGNFSDPDEVDVWVLGSKPDEVPPICFRIDVFPDETTQRLCP